jgi:hypothetical protein
VYKGWTELVLFSHGGNLYAADIEGAIKCDPLAKDAVIGGQRRARLFLLLDFAALGAKSSGRIGVGECAVS